MAKIQRALLSVSDKTGIVEFAAGLAGFEVEIYSTGGTAKMIKDAGLAVTEVAEYTGWPEMLDGRVKTLNPKIHGGILAIRDNQIHLDTCEKHGIKPIDLVAVNLYPFQATIAKPGCTFEQAIENIDIGGPAMIRSAAKNHKFVTVVTDPADYGEVLKQMKENDGVVSVWTNGHLAWKAFRLTYEYDKAIADYLQKTEAVKLLERGLMT